MWSGPSMTDMPMGAACRMLSRRCRSASRAAARFCDSIVRAWSSSLVVVSSSTVACSSSLSVSSSSLVACSSSFRVSISSAAACASSFAIRSSSLADRSLPVSIARTSLAACSSRRTSRGAIGAAGLAVGEDLESLSTRDFLAQLASQRGDLDDFQYRLVGWLILLGQGTDGDEQVTSVVVHDAIRHVVDRRRRLSPQRRVDGVAQRSGQGRVHAVDQVFADSRGVDSEEMARRRVDRPNVVAAIDRERPGRQPVQQPRRVVTGRCLADGGLSGGSPGTARLPRRVRSDAVPVLSTVPMLRTRPTGIGAGAPARRKIFKRGCSNEKNSGRGLTVSALPRARYPPWRSEKAKSCSARRCNSGVK